jgi:ABC-type lipoprotein release transport system permease subunit
MGRAPDERRQRLSSGSRGRYLESLLWDVSPRDPLAFAVSGAVLLLVSVAACLVPARRATRVSAIEALRFE